MSVQDENGLKLLQSKKKKKNAKLISLRSGWTWNQLYELANSQNRIEGSLIALQFLSLLFQISGNVCYK